MTDAIKVRFRHTETDLGPYTFQLTNNIYTVKEFIHQNWPTEGPLTKHVLKSTSQIKLVLNGKFLDGNQQLKDLIVLVGELRPNQVVTIHLIIQPHHAKAASKKVVDDEKQIKGCGCCVQ
eukprot:TRINITY_DN2296_c0_g1_i1.p2 TRINITY_DN2296_c0_g1~~TRINITY_DN2296_c0_g1_i1.p2  ORF type:complete len:120 (-),score=7.79 TRINITY_DN2296_c0_g1_i1:506-865(-)